MKKARFTEEQIIAVLRSTKRVLRRRMCVTRFPLMAARAPNQRWSMDSSTTR